MKHCIDQTGHWPNASADVSSNEMDDFLAHADACPYHAEILREEFEQELYSSFRLALGIDIDGHILRGSELQNAIAEHEKHAKEWEAVGSAESPFGLISLYNGGRLIAGSGDFLNYTYQQALHDLNPRDGLQIRAKCSRETDEEVLLYFYALRGVRHDGKEILVPLNNGYTVGLKVEQFGERNFEVHFRCVENSVLEREGTEDESTSEGKAKGASANGSSFSYLSLGGYNSIESVPQAPYWQSQSPTNLSGPAYVTLFVFIAGCILGGQSWINTEKLGTRLENLFSYTAEAGRQQFSGNTLAQNLNGSQSAQIPASTISAASAQAPDVLREKRLKRSIKRALAAHKNSLSPTVAVRSPWVIESSSNEIGTHIDIKHSGNDPELEAEVRKALKERGRLHEVTPYMASSDPKTSYETFWKIVRVEKDGVIQSKINIEVRPLPADDNSLRVYSGREFPILENATKLDYRTAVKVALEGVDNQVRYLLGLTQSGFAGDTTVNSTPGQELPASEPDSYRGRNSGCDTMEELKVVEPAGGNDNQW